jgi:hypothetical protein
VSTALLLFALGSLQAPAGQSSARAVDERDWHEPRAITTAQVPSAPVLLTTAESLAPPAAAATAPAVATKTLPAQPRFPDKLPFAGETTRYRIAYGLLGELGEVRISFSFPTDKVHAVGSGSGSFFGLGRIEKRVESELGPGRTNPQRWVTSRVQSGKTIVDTVDQTSPGQIAVLRRRSDRPEEGHRFTRQAPVLDPLAFLWRLRSQPPERGETFEVLDGRALWTIAMDATRVRSDGPTRKVLILTGKADPIFWDGRPDADRTTRTFTLYLEGDAQHTPLRLVMPLALGEVRVDLTSVSHAATRKVPTTLRAAANSDATVGTRTAAKPTGWSVASAARMIDLVRGGRTPLVKATAR